MGFEFYLPVEVYFGNGVLSRAGEIGRRFGFRTLVVTGRESAKRSGALDRLVNSLRAAGVEEVFLYDAVRPNPTDQMVNEGADLAVRKRIDFIVGLGGGSVLDTAKAIRRVPVSFPISADLLSVCRPRRERVARLTDFRLSPTPSAGRSWSSPTVLTTLRRLLWIRSLPSPWIRNLQP